MINAKDADAVSEPAVLMRYTIQMTVQMSFSTVKWQNMHRQSVTDAHISISRWFRISARTVTVMERTMHRSFRISECLQALIRSLWIRHVQMPASKQHRSRTASSENIWQNLDGIVITIISKIPIQTSNGRQLWIRQKRSDLEPENMN